MSAHEKIVLRQIIKDDARTMLLWRNHEKVRLQSHSKSLISLEAHMAWLENALNDEGMFLYMGVLVLILA